MTELKLIKMSDIQTEPVEWLWEPYIPRGAITLIQGDGGTGKTTMAPAIAAAVSRGDVLPGGISSEPVAVIVQNAEDSYTRTIRPRLEQSGADCSMIEVIDEDKKALSLSDGRIEDAIIRTNAKLLIIDPVQAYFGGKNMNNAGGVRPLMKHLGAVAARHGCAVLLVGHLHKKAGQAQYRGLGSIDIYAAARSVLTVGKIPVDENMRGIVHNKSNLSPAGMSQAFGLEANGGFCWLGDYDITIDEMLSGVSKPESQFVKAPRLIETALAFELVLAVEMEQRAEGQGISPKTLHRAKAALGVVSIKRGGRWYWQLPIYAEYTEVDQESQDGQHGQNNQAGQAEEGRDGHEKDMTNLTALTIFKNNKMEGWKFAKRKNDGLLFQNVAGGKRVVRAEDGADQHPE